MHDPARILTLSLLSFGAVGCSRAKEEAETAIGRSERMVTQLRSQADKILPEDMQRLGDSLQKAKDLAAAGEYQQARSAALGVSGRAISLAKVVGPKRAELDSTYKVISVEITQPVRQVVAKIRQHASSGSLPRGMKRPQFDSLRTVVIGWEEAWKSASESYKSGDLAIAASKAVEIKTSLIEAMKRLGLWGA